MTDNEKDPQAPVEREGVDRCQSSPEPDPRHSAGTDGRGQSASPAGDSEAAVAFLKLMYPLGPWVLTSIHPNRKAMETRTFQSDGEAAMLVWIKRYNGVRNCYFSINPTLREMSKKAEREDIKTVNFLHVDLDVRAGENLDAELQRIFHSLTDRLPRGVPKPTAIWWSGGGYWAVWKLREPIPIEGDLTKAEEAKCYNQQLELLLQGDHCHNIDRIARLPGTVNIPDAKKQKKGRRVALARLEQWNGEVYPISSFTKAAKVQMDGDSGSTISPGFTANVRRLQDVNELSEWNVPDNIKVIIVQGHDPDNPKLGDNSRSIWLFQVLCDLARRAVPDDVMYGIITDSDFGISASVIDKGSNAEKYALRQIASAKEEAISPWLRELNDRYFIVGNEGGRCRVMEEIIDPTLHRARLTRQTFGDFRNRYMNKKTQVGVNDRGKPVMAPVGEWWLGHEQRRQYDTIVFAPGQQIPKTYNLWQGYGFDSFQGDGHQSYLRHLRENVCGGVEEHFRYLLGWMARAVQRPGEQGHVAVVLRGGKVSARGSQ